MEAVKYTAIVYSPLNGNMEINTTLSDKPVKDEWVEIPMLNHRVQITDIKEFDGKWFDGSEQMK